MKTEMRRPTDIDIQLLAHAVKGCSSGISIAITCCCAVPQTGLAMP